MVVRFTSLITALAACTVISSVSASPLDSKIGAVKHLLRRDDFEWTAFGDSYSSGVGAGNYVSNSYRCLRYDNAYPVLVNADDRLPSGNKQFHNAVCSGSSTADVEAYQFFDEDTSGKPNSQYGTRPRFGNPSISTLSVGGNDVDFPGIIFNCILDLKIPGSNSPAPRTCDEQRTVTWNLLHSPDLTNRIDTTIKKIVEKARQGPIGNDFRLYVTGYPQFFSTKTNECDSVTFARTANPNPDGKEHTKLTQDIRKDFNAMSVQLNKAIADAVSRNANENVRWVPIDDQLEGHRFCEPGIKEPDQQNDKLWLYHYPYNEPKNDVFDGALETASDKVTNGVNIDTAFYKYTDFQSAVFDNLAGNDSIQGIQDPIWNYIGYRVKTFHPQIPLHEKIRDLVLDAYIQDTSPPGQDETKCHGIGGDSWIMSRDTAVDDVKQFCSQASNNVTYNSGLVNELSLLVARNGSTKQKPSDVPDCVARFTNTVIDGCDGNDTVNNPHNYKFGGTFLSTDGWSVTMTPRSKQIDEVSCGVYYQLLWDHFEIHGKDLPDAKFGANGEGLKAQISGCGDLTKWTFERTPSDHVDQFQWKATGRLPIGTKSCVGRALVSAGGANDGNCHGAGKRGAGLFG